MIQGMKTNFWTLFRAARYLTLFMLILIPIQKTGQSLTKHQ